MVYAGALKFKIKNVTCRWAEILIHRADAYSRLWWRVILPLRGTGESRVLLLGGNELPRDAGLEGGFDVFVLVVKPNQRDNDAAHGEPLGRAQLKVGSMVGTLAFWETRVFGRRGAASTDGTGGIAFFALLFAIMIAASAVAFFYASWGSRVFFSNQFACSHSPGISWVALSLGLGWPLAG